MSHEAIVQVQGAVRANVRSRPQPDITLLVPEAFPDLRIAVDDILG